MLEWTATIEKYREQLMDLPGVVDVALGDSGVDGPRILVYCTQPVDVPATLGGLPVETVPATAGLDPEA